MGLQRVAKAQNDNGKRFRIDHGELAKFLRQYGDDDIHLNFYVDAETSDNTSTKVMGKITKYLTNKGYGFISATDGNSYFFHNNEIINKKHLCNPHEDRYPHPTTPEFQKRLLGKVVTFKVVNTEDDKTRAEEVSLELGARSLDRFYRLRREPFLEMLASHDYNVVRCSPSHHPGKAKSIDVQICLDASWELADEDTFVLLSDDAIFSDLVVRLREADIEVVLATFDLPSSAALRDVVQKEGGRVVLLDDYLDELEFVFDSDYSDEYEKEELLQQA
jgi:uncharacterized LabA/DUF88 family protein